MGCPGTCWVSTGSLGRSWCELGGCEKWPTGLVYEGGIVYGNKPMEASWTIRSCADGSGMTSDPDHVSPDSIENADELKDALQKLRVLRTDTMSFEKMADATTEHRISRSEMNRIFNGEDFPSRGQLNQILKIMAITEEALEAWNRMWSRLAIHNHSDRTGAAPRQISRHSNSTKTAGKLEIVNNSQTAQQEIEDNATKIADRRAEKIIDNAQQEAEQLLAAAHTAADEHREITLQEARSAASRIIEKAISEQAQVIQNTGRSIAGIVNEAEERLRDVIAALNRSVDTTSEEFKQLLTTLRTSVVEVRDELEHIKGQTEILRERFQIERPVEHLAEASNLDENLESNRSERAWDEGLSNELP